MGTVLKHECKLLFSHLSTSHTHHMRMLVVHRPPLHSLHETRTGSAGIVPNQHPRHHRNIPCMYCSSYGGLYQPHQDAGMSFEKSLQPEPPCLLGFLIEIVWNCIPLCKLIRKHTYILPCESKATWTPFLAHVLQAAALRHHLSMTFSPKFAVKFPSPPAATFLASVDLGTPYSSAALLIDISPFLTFRTASPMASTDQEA